MNPSPALPSAPEAWSLERLDIDIVCAGLYNVFEAFSMTGYEESIQVNYLLACFL